MGLSSAINFMLNYTYMGDVNYYLFSNPTFIEGMGQVLDLGGTMNMYNVSPTEVEADAIALYSDWKAVGKDISDSIETYGKGGAGA